MEICIDFDGTCVTHEFPKVGKDIGAVPVLKKLVEAGHKLILFTMRSNRPVPNETGDPTIMDVTGMFLDDAVNWFKQNDIPLHGINENPTQKNWTNDPIISQFNPNKYSGKCNFHNNNAKDLIEHFNYFLSIINTPNIYTKANKYNL